jgi:hypothetical protein
MFHIYIMVKATLSKALHLIEIMMAVPLNAWWHQIGVNGKAISISIERMLKFENHWSIG